jgi:RimJ/RimL family protein N-acetyltransferase
MPRLRPPDPPLADGAIALRRWRLADVDALVAAMGDPLIARFNTRIPQPYRERDARAWLASHDDALWRGTALDLAIADAGSDAILGGIGISEVDWPQHRATAGYWVAASARGRGIATTALRLVSGWAFERLRLGRLQLTIDVDNDASQRVAERAGYRREGVLRAYVEHGGERRDMLLYARVATDPAPDQ